MAISQNQSKYKKNPLEKESNMIETIMEILGTSGSLAILVSYLSRSKCYYGTIIREATNRQCFRVFVGITSGVNYYTENIWINVTYSA